MNQNGRKVIKIAQEKIVSEFLNSGGDFLELRVLFAVVIKALIFGGMVAVFSWGRRLTRRGILRALVAQLRQRSLLVGWRFL